MPEVHMTAFAGPTPTLGRFVSLQSDFHIIYTVNINGGGWCRGWSNALVF
jgi:hypothetical protein